MKPHWIAALLVSVIGAVLGAAPPSIFNVTVPPPTEKEDISIGATTRSIKIEGDSFTLDGKPFRYVSGSLHYFRVPAAYWRDRLRKLRAGGLNAVSTYVEWSFHEPEEGQYNWEGDRDLVQFIQIAAEEGLLVLLRPGPYICAERDLGGFPYWLLSKNLILRSPQPAFITEVEKWFNVLFEKMKPLLYNNGGPIILVQVENEYGSYGKDLEYKNRLRDIIHGHVQNAAILYTTDGSNRNMITNGAINGTLTTIDFNCYTNAASAFQTLRTYMPKGPLVNSEFYTGWLTHWGEQMAQTPTKDIVSSLRKQLDLGASVNMYVFFGGTNFEFTAGANWGAAFEPDITSYDYDAPLTEAGDYTPKYNEIKKLLQQYYPEVEKLQQPEPWPKVDLGKVTVRPQLEMLTEAGRAALGNASRQINGSKLPSFEELKQRAGFVLYEVDLPEGDAIRLLQVSEVRDRIQVFVNEKLQGILSRMTLMTSLPLRTEKNSKLSLLVEHMGRINFGQKLHDYKGLIDDVLLDNSPISGQWSVLGFPLEKIPEPKSKSSPGDENVPATVLETGPVLYEGTFSVDKKDENKDTFLDVTGWSKGYVWVNGFNLGRYWPEKGPQVTLYVPGSLLHVKPQVNTLQLLELDAAPAQPSVNFTSSVIIKRSSHS